MANEKPAELMQTYYKPETEHQKHASTFMAYVIFGVLVFFSLFFIYYFG